MKKAIILTVAMALATPAMAEQPKGCNGYGLGTLVDVDENGKNCPPAKWEKSAGELLSAATLGLALLGVIHVSGGAKVFPLGG